MGMADKIIRLVIAALIAVLYFTGTISGITGIILLIVAGVFILTSLIGSCPLYFPLGIKTMKSKK